jgi:tRNA(Ile)-lysidine synthase
VRRLAPSGHETGGLRDLADQAREVMDRRLQPKSRRPIAVAFSGGGDSLALLLAAQAWAARTRRALVALNVDHRLNADSAQWAETCARTADRLGVEFQGLAWTGHKPATGLPAAGRIARHRLLAAAARAIGARVILMGHTADDVIEARLMREAGATTPSPVEWSPSPAWPEGRGLFLLRPLLGARRAEIRKWLSRRGESWIDDPANADARYSRPRARRTAAACETEPPPQASALSSAEDVEESAGAFRLSRARVLAAGPDEAARVLAIACVCAGGGARTPAAARVRNLVDRLASDISFVGTLAGARIEVRDDAILICREPGEAARGGLGALALTPGEALVWDGRVQLKAARDGLSVRRLSGLARQLPRSQQTALSALPPAIRGGLPAVLDEAGAVSCPLLGETAGVKAKVVVRKRFRAAAGLIRREPD